MGTYVLRTAAVASNSSVFWAGFNTTINPGDYSNTNPALIQAINSIISGRFLTLGGQPGQVPINTYTIRFSAGLSDNVWELDGNPAVSFNTLPAGFLIQSATLSLAKDTSSVPTSGGRYTDDALASLFISFDALHETSIANPSVNGGPTGSFVYPLALVALNILTGGTGVRIVTGTLDAFFACRDLHIAGSYTTYNFTSTLDKTTQPIKPNVSHITITSDPLDPLHLKLNHVTPHVTDTNGDNIVPTIITQTETQLTFLAPILTGTPQTIQIVIVGDGTQFTGSVTLGKLYTINFINAPGIYRLSTNKLTDTLYDVENGGTIEVAKPNPFMKSGFVG